MTPIITEGGLYLFMEPTSPKGRDLRDRGWSALHNGVPDDAGTGGEFHVSGDGLRFDDPATWWRVAAAAGYNPLDRYILFDLRLTEARCHGYGDVELPATRRWRAANPRLGEGANPAS